MPLRKRIQIATIAFFCLVISVYVDVEVLERLGVHLINVHPHPQFYGNAFGNLTPNRAATVSWGTRQTYRYTTDGQGLRGTGQPSAKTPARTVLCLGDSYTFGLNVADAETFPAQLARMLDQRDGQGRVRVVNGGSPSTGIEDHYLYYRDKARSLRPELVVLQFNVYDLDLLRGSPLYIPKAVAPHYERFLDDSYMRDISFTILRPIASTPAYAFLTQGLPQGPGKPAPPKPSPGQVALGLGPVPVTKEMEKVFGERATLLDESNNRVLAPIWQRYLDMLGRLNEAVRADGGRLLLVIAPDPVQAHYYINGPGAAIAPFCRAQGIPLLDFTRPFRLLRVEQGRTAFLESDIHCGPEGNAMIARGILEAMDKGLDPAVLPPRNAFLPGDRAEVLLGLDETGRIVAPEGAPVAVEAFTREGATLKREAGGSLKYLTTDPEKGESGSASLTLRLKEPSRQVGLVVFPHLDGGNKAENGFSVTLSGAGASASFSTDTNEAPNLWRGFEGEAVLEAVFPEPVSEVRLDFTFRRNGGFHLQEVFSSRPHRRLALHLYPDRTTHAQ